MPVRKMTQQEVRDWLGKGIVLSGIKPPKRLPQPTSDTETEVADNPKNGDGKWPAGAAKDTAWLPTVPPENAEEELLAIYPRNIGDAPNAPHVRRAMSLAPAEAIGFFALNDVQYLPPEAILNLPVNPRSISKSQVELVASRVSSLNGCFYWTASHSDRLRVSLQTNKNTDLRIVTGAAADVEIEDGVLFVRYVEAIVTGTVAEVASTRDALFRVLGNDAVVDAAAVAALFHAINRLADAIGIQFEKSKLERTADLRDQLAFDGMETARFSE